MQQLSDVYKRFKQMRYKPVTGAVAFEPLAHELNEDETMLKLLEGSFHSTVGLFIATDIRIFYIGINKLNDVVLEQVAYEEIESINISEPKFISVEISIKTNHHHDLIIKGCDYQEGKEFVELIRMLTVYNSVQKAG
jgi:hypothetical protein